MAWTDEGEWVDDETYDDYDPSLSEGADYGTWPGQDADYGDWQAGPLESEPLFEPSLSRMPEERESPGLPDDYYAEASGGRGGGFGKGLERFLSSTTGGLLTRAGLGGLSAMTSRQRPLLGEKTVTRTEYDPQMLEQMMGRLNDVWDRAANAPGYQPIKVGSVPGLSNAVSQPDFSNQRALLRLAGGK